MEQNLLEFYSQKLNLHFKNTKSRIKLHFYKNQILKLLKEQSGK